MERDRREGFFQGKELPKLLLLAAVAVAGWAIVLKTLASPRPAPAEPQTVVKGKPRPIETDQSPEFESVKDKTPTSFFDTAAYKKLLTQTRELDAKALSTKARRDVFYAHLWQTPAEFRGVPVHLVGTARRVMHYPSKLSQSGWLYEAWVITPESQNNPLVCVFEDAPDGFPEGTDVAERITFDGYFLKLMAYEAGDKRRGAPLLVGRLSWTPSPAGSPASYSPYWLIGALGLMGLLALARWISWMKRTLSPKPTVSRFRTRPTEEIDPEDLSAYLDKLGDEPEV